MFTMNGNQPNGNRPNGNQPVPFRLRQQNGLHGKVALVVCDQEEAVRGLVIGLAKRGVNIALACVAEPCKNLIRDEVEARGRRFLAVRGRINSVDVVAQVMWTFGQLDLFIDCSTEGKRKPGQASGDMEDLTPGPDQSLEVFANSILARAAFRALT